VLFLQKAGQNQAPDRGRIRGHEGRSWDHPINREGFSSHEVRSATASTICAPKGIAIRLGGRLRPTGSVSMVYMQPVQFGSPKGISEPTERWFGKGMPFPNCLWTGSEMPLWQSKTGWNGKNHPK
jgi:hypothetical protein